ncbi:MAG: hypothetical protein ACPG47_02145 [Leucothrix sp.]
MTIGIRAARSKEEAIQLGLPTYNSLEPCEKAKHISTVKTDTGECLECLRIARSKRAEDEASRLKQRARRGIEVRREQAKLNSLDEGWFDD